MPNYHYRCENCPTDFEIYQSIKEEPIQYCNDCKTMGLYRVIHCVEVIDKTPKTIGSLAEENSKKMGKELVAIKDAEIKSKKPKKKNPWWRPDSDKPIDHTKIKDMKKYIYEGKIE